MVVLSLLVKGRASRLIYAIQAGGRKGPIKFGLALDPKDRLGNLQVAHHQKLVLLATQETTDDQAVEALVHKHLAKDCIRGEWFRASKQALDVVMSIRLGIVAESVQAAPVSQYRRANPKELEIVRHFLKRHVGPSEPVRYG